ncbi:ribosomal RNA small subunit methyltransferase A [Candidatus Kaiserbacteria bacterium CG10_big_fil_rev_8_21_14_0_10_51_14]|uniref:Ribosomal RNA small subunit methyltransferase A n=1 Tax=Candidatus Kaiserbacteria bacterium CG10_big_fil_rev_8_21_14_0_10_51_14 TaxID=1974610 RepID=A0A2H0UCV3_9BACT|nr:MAG: ribosomal RNA small subunit methyltransferase A [Candidatus Kaiserbacteria bacterium CG10_big_fil_rev_8_21_14_0_10_51_14]
MITMRSARKSNPARLGQHFLTNPNPARVLAQAAAPKIGEIILEIGPGTGMLTRELLATGAEVIAIEKDPALVVRLRKSNMSGNLRIVEADVRDVTPQGLGLKNRNYVVAANIPYYITGEIIRQFLTTDAPPRAMALLIQKEVADRILARDGKESILSISVKAYGIPKIIAKVSRGNFNPPPSVDSAILLVDEISKKTFVDIREDMFFKVVKAGFASKRKFLANNLSTLFPKETITHAFRENELSAKVRAEDVSLLKWKMLTKLLIR